MQVTTLEPTEKFQRDLKKVPRELLGAFTQALQGLMQHPMPRKLRHHTLHGYQPTVHCIDVTPNHAYQITFTLNGPVARLLRVGTHKQISHDPEG